MQPPEEISLNDDVFGESSHEAPSRRRRNRFAVPLGRLRNTGDFENRRYDVDHMSRSFSQFAAGRNAGGPMHHQRRADASFMNPGLVTPKRRVRQTGKAGTQAEISRGAAERSGRIVTAVANHDLGAGAVIGGKEDERIV